jgi:hypothetical protein
MAALMLHQACEHFYLCVLWSRTLHGPRTHALDELREAAEALDARLSAAWPRETPFERRAFGCIRRAYAEARYGRSYRITEQELAWTFGRVEILREQVLRGWANHHVPVAAAVPALVLPSRAETAVAVVRSQPSVSTRLPQGYGGSHVDQRRSASAGIGSSQPASFGVRMPSHDGPIVSPLRH